MATRSKTPTARTLEALRKMGAVAGVVERRIPKSFVTVDLFGFIDIIALVGPNLIGIQATSGNNHAARRTKILSEPKAMAWLKTGALIEVWSWAKKGKRGERKLWTCRKEEIVETDFS